MRSFLTITVVCLVLAGFIAALQPDSYAYVLFAQCLVFSLWAIAYNLVYGYMGEISFGHSAYFGLGAYAVPLLMDKVELPFGAAILVAPFFAGAVAALVAFIIRGTRGIYFAIATFVFAQGIFIVTLKWTGFTGGDNGLPVSRPDLLSSARDYALFCLAVVGVAIACLYRVVDSPAGRVIVAARENERRARQIGYDTTAYRILAFTISGLFSGLAGALFSPLLYFISPDVLFWVMSGQVIIMTIVGGSQAFLGPAIGATFLVIFQDAVSGLSGSSISIGGVNLATLGEHWLLFLGLTFYAIILFEPGGITALAEKALDRMRGGRPAAATSPSGRPEDADPAHNRTTRKLARTGGRS